MQNPRLPGIRSFVDEFQRRIVFLLCYRGGIIRYNYGAGFDRTHTERGVRPQRIGNTRFDQHISKGAFGLGDR